MRSGARNIRAAFTSSRLTHFGGVYLFHRFLQQLQLRTYLSMSIPYPQRNNRYTLSEIILALIYPMILGLEKIEVSEVILPYARSFAKTLILVYRVIISRHP